MTLFDPRVLGARPAGLRRERIEASPRYVDGPFQNTARIESVDPWWRGLTAAASAEAAPRSAEAAPAS